MWASAAVKPIGWIVSDCICLRLQGSFRIFPASNTNHQNEWCQKKRNDACQHILVGRNLFNVKPSNLLRLNMFRRCLDNRLACLTQAFWTTRNCVRTCYAARDKTQLGPDETVEENLSTTIYLQYNYRANAIGIIVICWKVVTAMYNVARSQKPVTARFGLARFQYALNVRVRH